MTTDRHYVLPDKAKQVEALLRQRQQEGIYDRVTDAEQLAQQLTDDVQRIAPDRHMMVGFSADPLPPDSKGGRGRRRRRTGSGATTS